MTNWKPVRDKPERPWGGGEVRSTAEARVMPVEGRDLSSRQTQYVVRDREDWATNQLCECSKTAEGVTRESKGVKVV